jgi:PleD family two-component response regulator
MSNRAPKISIPIKTPICQVSLHGGSELDFAWLQELLSRSKARRFELGRMATVETQASPSPPSDVVLAIHGSADQTIHTALPASSEVKGAPIVVLGEVDDESLALRCMEAGAYSYLTRKDVNTRLLVTTLVAAVESRRSMSLLGDMIADKSERAKRDPLIQLVTREIFHDRVGQALAAAGRTGRRIAVLYTWTSTISS